MDALGTMLGGFSVALAPENLLYVFIGVLVGMIIGVLPGLGSSATMALVLPFTFQIPPAGALIMLAGIYYGSMYGGTITSVLLRLPGEAATVVTMFDGHQMAKQGRAGTALGIAAIGSFVGGTIAVLGLSFLAPPLAKFALRFGAPEYAILALFGILLVSYLGTKSLVKCLVSASAGLLLATIGQDPVTGSPRFTFGSIELLGGLDFLVLAVGLFGIADILHSLEERRGQTIATGSVGRVWPSRRDLRESSGAIARGSVVGFFVGLLPGGGGPLSSLASYGIEKRRAKRPERFGRGAIEGVAGPETANNAGSTSAFIPLLTLGIPANSATAILYGALLLQGITPGPFLITEEPDVFWGVIDSMYVGNLFLLVLSIPLVGLFIQLLRVRLSILGPITIVVTMLGAYSINNNAFDMWVALAAGIVGYLMMKAGFEPGPLVLAFLLGSLLESSFRRSLAISDGNFSIFVTRPISACLLALIVLALLNSARLAIKRKRAGVANGRERKESADDRRLPGLL